MNRRQLIKYSSLVMGGLASFSSALEDSIRTSNSDLFDDIPLGVQLFTIPSLVEKDLKGTLRQLSEIGYREVEFFGPYSFSDPTTIQQWEMMKGMMGLNQNAFYGFSTEEVASMLREYGLSAPSMHTDLLTLQNQMAPMLDEAAKLDTKYLIIPAIMEGRSSLDDYKLLCEQFNAFGSQMKSHGMQFAYHNHGYEHIEMNGEIPMNFLLEHTDPDVVKFELDIFWMSAAGADPLEYLKSYPNHFKLLHLKDASVPVRFSGDGGTPDQWMAIFPNMADPGDGVLDVASIVKQAKKSGVQHYYLERDLAPDPHETLTNSYAKLSKM